MSGVTTFHRYIGVMSHANDPQTPPLLTLAIDYLSIRSALIVVRSALIVVQCQDSHNTALNRAIQLCLLYCFHRPAVVGKA